MKASQYLLGPFFCVRQWFVTYVCFRFGLEDAVEVDLASEIVDFSSSWCTAIEKRFQNAGSRTPAIANARRLRRGSLRSQWILTVVCIRYGTEYFGSRTFVRGIGGVPRCFETRLTMPSVSNEWTMLRHERNECNRSERNREGEWNKEAKGK